MIGVGLGLFFGGYTLLAYGWSQLRGSNASLVSLVWPGSFTGANPDPPNSGGGAVVSGGAKTGVKTASGAAQAVPTSAKQAAQWAKSGTAAQKTAAAQYVYATGNMAK